MVKQKINTRFWRYLLGVVVIIFLNLISSTFYNRYDLTQDKRFTLSQSSKDLAAQLDDVVYISVFLDGNLPTEYKRLQAGIENMLNSFRRASNNNLEFRFEDLQTGKSLQERDDILRQLASKGLNIVKAEVSSEKETADKFLVPGALAVFNEKEYPINFLKREFGKGIEQEINSSLEQLEYEIGNTVRRCVEKRKGTIAYTIGHGELSELETADFSKALSDNFRIESINLNLLDTNILKPFAQELNRNPEKQGEILLTGIMNQLNKYEMLLVAKPTIQFLDEELLLIDQYIMSGGKVIWMIDELNAEMDSVAKYTTIMTASRQLRVSDLLFKYGARINSDLVQSKNAHGIQVMATNGASKPTFLPWYFYPLLEANPGHPISKSIGTVWGRFVNSIDTLPSRQVKKTVLLHTNEYSRVENNPARISMRALGLKPTPEMFPTPQVPVALLLEGKFNSLFAKRRAFKGRFPFEFKSEVKNNAMIIVSDGDIIRNQVSKTDNQVYPLGYDRFASTHFKQPVTFSNKEFMLNCVEYLTSDNDLIEVRAKKLEMRLLDKTKVEQSRDKWVWINMLGPILFLILFAVINQFIRKRKYTS